MLARCFLFLFAVCGVSCFSCGGEVAETLDFASCDASSLDDYCRRSNCRNLEERVHGSEGLCDRGLDSFAHVLTTGCGYTELRTLGRLGSAPIWFATETGELVGTSYLSDVDPECNGTLFGRARPDDCEEVVVSECSLCGWDTCEWQTCADEFAACSGNFPCTALWECSQDTGCEGEECAVEETCPHIWFDNAPSALASLDALLVCVNASDCSATCPLSMREPAGPSP